MDEARRKPGFFFLAGRRSDWRRYIPIDARPGRQGEGRHRRESAMKNSIWCCLLLAVLGMGHGVAARGQDARPEPGAAVAAACAALDADGDGVDDCRDKCPGSKGGQAIGADGCAVPLLIVLKGVNFDFDKSALRPEAIAILDEAVVILGKYPQLRVEVAGHADSVGSEQYNQDLSERRARAVHEYLTGHGIDPGRLLGPNGYGETRPIAPNTREDGSDDPEGRARNRRAELNVQSLEPTPAPGAPGG
jgi:OOP family OmpA-OmpF porin